MFEIKEAIGPPAFAIARDLFEAYARELEVDLSFQNFEDELEELENMYSRPDGILFIAYSENGEPVGCFGLRKLEETTCELKRMYIRKESRGLGLGRLLLEKSFEVGRMLGYQRMRLDTLPRLKAAISLYKRSGFYEIEPYRYNPISEASFYEKLLIP